MCRRLLLNVRFQVEVMREVEVTRQVTVIVEVEKVVTATPAEERVAATAVPTATRVIKQTRATDDYYATIEKITQEVGLVKLFADYPGVDMFSRAGEPLTVSFGDRDHEHGLELFELFGGGENCERKSDSGISSRGGS